MLRIKQRGIKYHFLSLWYDSTWDWTPVSRAIDEHSNRLANGHKILSAVLSGVIHLSVFFYECLTEPFIQSTEVDYAVPAQREKFVWISVQ